MKQNVHQSTGYLSTWHLPVRKTVHSNNTLALTPVTPEWRPYSVHTISYIIDLNPKKQYWSSGGSKIWHYGWGATLSTGREGVENYWECKRFNIRYLFLTCFAIILLNYFGLKIKREGRDRTKLRMPPGYASVIYCIQMEKCALVHNRYVYVCL